jgi:thioredoxin-like negative regulator of GroEL
MTPLPSHEFFETLIARKPDEVHKPLVILKFGATWCGPCKRLDMDQIVASREDAEWYECDADEHETTMIYAGVQTIPAFLAIVNGKPKPLFQSSDTKQVVMWASGLTSGVNNP